MNIYVYSDESGVFDKKHNDIYVFGGMIFISKDDKDNCSRKYLHAEKIIRNNSEYSKFIELKACKITNKEKGKLFRSLNEFYKFGAVIKQNAVHNAIFDNKKSKQRYLDYVYKIALKRAFQKLILNSVINEKDVSNIYIYADEHTTATNGRYELKEGLEREFKIGTFNYDYQYFYEPIFKKLDSISLTFCDSSVNPCIRCADIVANHLYFKSVNYIPINKSNFFISYFP